MVELAGRRFSLGKWPLLDNSQATWSEFQPCTLFNGSSCRDAPLPMPSSLYHGGNNTFLYVSSTASSPTNCPFVATAARQHIRHSSLQLRPCRPRLLPATHTRQVMTPSISPSGQKHLSWSNSFAQVCSVCSARLQQVMSLVGHRTSKGLLIQRVNAALLTRTSQMVE